MKLVYRYRVKSRVGELNRQARVVNFVWNYMNDRQKDAIKWGRKWLMPYDFDKLTVGTSKNLGINSTTLTQMSKQYVRSRRQHNRPWLRYRGRRSLGWVPFQGRSITVVADGFMLKGIVYRVFYSRPIPENTKICDGSNFSQDAKGNWYLNLVLDVPAPKPREPINAVGIDLGLKDFATLSTGEKIENPKHFQRIEERYGVAQRARKKKQARNLRVRAANRRRDMLHKLSHRLTNEFDFIAVGDIAPAPLARTTRK